MCCQDAFASVSVSTPNGLSSGGVDRNQMELASLPNALLTPPSLAWGSAVASSWLSILTLLGLTSVAAATAERVDRCYSCSSSDLHAKWPRSHDNTLMYLTEFPVFMNDSCETMRGALPVVPCVNSVCVKMIIEEPPAARAVCESGPVLIRDCWSRVIGIGNQNFALKPYGSKPVRLASEDNFDNTVGQVFTCKGYLCNSVSSTTPTSALLVGVGWHLLKRLRS